MSEEEALKILRESECGVLCTFDGVYPYGVPVNYVYDDGYIYIHSAKEGHKLECIKKLDRVCFVVVGRCRVVPEEFSTNYESVVVFEKVEILYGQEAIEPLRYASNTFKEKRGIEKLRLRRFRRC